MSSPATRDDYQEAVRQAVFDNETFLRLTLSGGAWTGNVPWGKVAVRPVEIKGLRHFQFSYFDAKKDTARNFAGDEARARLDEVLAMPFRQIHLQTSSGDLHVRITKKGRALVKRGRPSRPDAEPNLQHDRAKRHPLSPETAGGFLEAIGVIGRGGEVRPSMQAKFRQINEFLRLLEQTIPASNAPEGLLRIVDCGCGKAYLTLAARHYLTEVQGRTVRVTGVDHDAEVIERCRELVASLGWEGVAFRVSKIAEFSPETPPDVVLSLHACDTATDEAIAQGIRWGSRVILAAPCCQHELHGQLSAEVLQPILRYGILRQRTADIATDAFRALVLRIMGYRTDVVEFVDPEHTAKNLMIRASRGPRPGNRDTVRQYAEMKAFWGVRPSIETLLGDRFQEVISQA
ncbi:MAG: SAM-dependent methyltransferase [Phycisphaerae bacterium]|nr:SAM-dependent methyltransferase [Phycisphaerae bacterium]